MKFPPAFSRLGALGVHGALADTRHLGRGGRAWETRSYFRAAGGPFPEDRLPRARRAAAACRLRSPAPPRRLLMFHFVLIPGSTLWLSVLLGTSTSCSVCVCVCAHRIVMDWCCANTWCVMATSPPSDVCASELNSEQVPSAAAYS
uniref:Uncharacterized protein n=1 Tax=Gallus gallus TaxID=9031 RepID=A0A8V0XHK7_CHICK